MIFLNLQLKSKKDNNGYLNMILKPTFAVGIPTINRYDLLKSTLEKYTVDFKDTTVLIVDNGNQHITAKGNMSLFTSPKNLGVAGSWNFLTKELFRRGFSHALILNDDIYLGANQDIIQDVINSDTESSLFVSSSFGMCAFILPLFTSFAIGDFDEKFYPAYYEDDDFLYRLKLANANVDKSILLNPYTYLRSQSIDKDPRLNQKYLSNRDYYVQKWGGIPGEEKFVNPFNS